MTEVLCLECKRQCFFKARPKEDELFGAPCDYCKNVFCRKCAKINTSEAQAVACTQRSVLFCCPCCRERILRELPKLKTLLKQLEKYKAESMIKSGQIEKLENEYEDKTKELQQMIDHLNLENKQKDSHITRLKRRTQDFEDSTFNAVEDYEKDLTEKGKQIGILNKEIIDLLRKNKSLLDKIEEFEVISKRFAENETELETVRKNMLTSIEVLTGENESYLNDLKKANREVCALKEQLSNINDATELNRNMKTTIEVLESQGEMYLNELTQLRQELEKERIGKRGVQEEQTGTVDRVSTNGKQRQTAQEDQVIVNSASRTRSSALGTNCEEPQHKTQIIKSMPRPKVILLTDGSGKKIYRHLNNVLGAHYDLRMFGKPFARFREVVSSVDCFLGELSSSDYVVVMAGLNDTITLNDITYLANKCFYTNLIVCTLPMNYNYCQGSTSIVNVVNMNNECLQRTINKLKMFSVSIDLLDLTGRFNSTEFAGNTLFLNRKGLIRLSVLIGNSVVGFSGKKEVTNLVQVRTGPNALSVASESTLDEPYMDNRNIGTNPFLESPTPLTGAME